MKEISVGASLEEIQKAVASGKLKKPDETEFGELLKKCVAKKKGSGKAKKKSKEVSRASGPGIAECDDELDSTTAASTSPYALRSTSLPLPIALRRLNSGRAGGRGAPGGSAGRARTRQPGGPQCAFKFLSMGRRRVA